MKIAAIQMNSSDKPDENIHKALKLIEEAASQNADFVVLPEYVNFMGGNSDKLKFGEEIPGPTSKIFAEAAKKHNIYLNCGSILEIANETHLYNTSILFNDNGETIGTYRKIHLYDAEFEDRYSVKESSIFKPGNEVIVTDTSFGKVGLAICYDIRFPELFRTMALQGSKIIFVPAAFPLYTGAHHWEVLLRARAIENQCYIVAAGQFGVAKPNMVEFGNSMIIDPWGTVLSRAPEKEGIIISEIDLSYIDKIRNQIPCFKHRKPNVYNY